MKTFLLKYEKKLQSKILLSISDRSSTSFKLLQ